MDKMEFNRQMGAKNNGFLHLMVNLALLVGTILAIIGMCHINGMIDAESGEPTALVLLPILSGCVLLFVYVLHLVGFMIIQPNQSRVLTFFGRYSGTVRQNGFFWVNPFYAKRKISLRARNMDVPPIKVNDRNGNPIMIGLVLVWKIADTYKAVFDIDVETLQSASQQSGQNAQEQTALKGYDSFVHVQSDAALRKVAGHYAYDNMDHNSNELTLRSGAEEINTQLESELRSRLSIAGIEVIEARINYLAYASEIASVMLRRQQADAIISAREKIVEGAVSMVELALNKLNERQVVQLDEEKKATMVSNLLVVLCADESASPVINTGSIY
ncbi:MAG: SPFH domain-containing protein [Bacteroidales bacterium]|nr:SPFH domain-containing protein [Bacteroidales bacterium]